VFSETKADLMTWKGRIIGLAVIGVCTIGGYLLVGTLFSPQQQTTPLTVASATDSMVGMDHSMMDMPIPTRPAEGDFNTPLLPEGIPPAAVEQGAQPLDFRIEGGFKVFDLTAQPVLWNLLEDVPAPAWTYNGMVPGPLIRVSEGDQVRINLTNQLEEPTTLHVQGIGFAREFSQDGIGDLTQVPISPGETYTYEFTASGAGSFVYYPETNKDYQMSLGLFGPIIVDPQTDAPQPTIDVPIMISEWRVFSGVTFPAAPASGFEPNYFTMNGKAYPATETIQAQVGDVVRLHLYGMGSQFHPIHLNGFAFEVIGMNGTPLAEDQRFWRDTILVAPGEQYDIQFTPDRPGMWFLRCNIGAHTINNFDSSEEGGLNIVFDVSA
jgi:FtsP/CotA-like multicopper oxidase with cupredoxin domain